MKSERAKAIGNRKADYIIGTPDYAHAQEWLLSCGYHTCCVMVVENGKIVKTPLPIYAKE